MVVTLSNFFRLLDKIEKLEERNAKLKKMLDIVLADYLHDKPAFYSSYRQELERRAEEE